MGGGEVVWHSVEVEEDTYRNTLTDLHPFYRGVRTFGDVICRPSAGAARKQRNLTRNDQIPHIDEQQSLSI